MKVMYTASENAFDLLTRMIEYDPAKRITAAVYNLFLLKIFLLFTSLTGSTRSSLFSRSSPSLNEVIFCYSLICNIVIILISAFDKSIMSNIPFPIRKAQDHPHQ